MGRLRLNILFIIHHSEHTYKVQLNGTHRQLVTQNERKLGLFYYLKKIDTNRALLGPFG